MGLRRGDAGFFAGGGQAGVLGAGLVGDDGTDGRAARQELVECDFYYDYAFVYLHRFGGEGECAFFGVGEFDGCGDPQAQPITGEP